MFCSHFTNEMRGDWDRGKSTAVATLRVTAQHSAGVPDRGHVVSLMFTTTLEEAAWHKDVNSEPKKLALCSISRSA